MTDRIILSIVSVTMLLLAIRQQGRFSKIITGGLTIGILLIWIANPILITISFVIYTICSLLTVIYGIIQNHLSTQIRIIICLTGLIVLTRGVFAIQRYPFANEMKWLMIIPVITYFIFIIHTKIKITPETSFMTILMIGCLLQFFKLWT